MQATRPPSKRNSPSKRTCKITGKASAWVRFAGIMQKPLRLIEKTKGKKRSIARRAALFMMESALLAALVIGGANLADQVGQKPNLERFSESQYSQNLKDWQQKTRGQHHGVKMAVLDIDRLIIKGLDPETIHEQVKSQAKDALGPAAYWIGSLFDLYDKSADYALKNRPTGWTQAMIAPSPYWRTSSAANPDIYAHLYARITIVVPPHNLQTSEDYLRLMGNVFDPSMRFRSLPPRAEIMDFVMGDEIGHGFDFNWGRSDFDRLKQESFGDIMGVLQVVSKYGTKSELPDIVRDLRVIGAVEGATEHYTAPALDVAIPLAKKLYALGKLQQMSLMQRAKLAQKIVAAVWEDETSFEAVKALAAEMPKEAYAAQNAEFTAKLKPAKTPEAAQILKAYKTATKRLFVATNPQEISDIYKKQLDNLLDERGISPQHRRLIIAYAEHNLAFLKFAEKNTAGHGKLLNEARQKTLNSFIKRCEKAGIDKKIEPTAPRFNQPHLNQLSFKFQSTSPIRPKL